MLTIRNCRLIPALTEGAVKVGKPADLILLSTSPACVIKSGVMVC